MTERKPVRIRIIRCGSMTVPETAAFSGGTPLSTTPRRLLAGRQRRVELPVFAFLIETPQARILVDCGWPRAVAPAGGFDKACAAKLLGAPLADFYRPALPAGDAVSEQLAALGIRPEDLDCVLLTHLDPDHCGDIRQLTAAKKILLPEDEYFWACRTVYKARQPWGLWENIPLERCWYRGTAFGPVKWSFDVLGDGSIIAVNCPGHTDGMCAVLVYNGTRYVLLAADAAFSPRNWEHMTVPGYGFDEKRQLKSLAWVKEQAESPLCAAVFCSHDPSLKPGVFELI